jgi:hypothetical protein
MTTPTEIELPPLSDPQLAILEATERCVDAEGAIRSGSRRPPASSSGSRCGIPGSICLASRWKQQDVDGQLRALWRAVWRVVPGGAASGLERAEECYEFQPVDGKVSRLYMRSLKASEETGRYSKFRGLTLAFIWLEQAEEIPEDVYVELKGRLSQPGYDKQILLTPNPVDEDHWIAAHFPTDGNKPNHRYITSDVYSNRAVLGDAVIEGFEEDYPEGHPKRRTLIQGLRGVNVIGKPVYDGYFTLSHVKPLSFRPEYELLEAWDFGHAHPAVVWSQYYPAEDRLHVLGAVQGKDMFLEDFAPEVQAIREEWFPFALTQTWCDPSGETGNQGIKQTALLTLRDHDIPAQPAEKANDPVVRDKAIQTVSALMWRRRFAIDPKCIELSRVNGRIQRRESRLVVSALSVGYVWDERKNVRSNPNIRSPRKQTRYDHTMNCLEYIVVGARIPSKPRPGDLQKAAARHTPAIQRVHRQALKAEVRSVREAQRDRDPADTRYRVSFASRRRGGY